MCIKTLVDFHHLRHIYFIEYFYQFRETLFQEIDTVMHMNRALQVKLDSIKSTMAQYAGQISHEAGKLMALKKRDDDLIKYIDQNIDKTDKPNWLK